MSGDHARFSFDPHKAFSGMWHQQGRVSLEADFNEFEEILDRLRRASTYDTVGAAVVPITTKDGFKLDVDTTTNELTIGVGRAYVDGIMVECFGDKNPPPLLNPHLGHQYWAAPLPLSKQPFGYTKLPEGKDPVLVYLDAWRREVTVYEDDDLREPALGGPDTTTRLQTVWQVKALQSDKPPPSPADCDADWPGWDDLVTPSSARLTVTCQPAPAGGACTVPAKAGYIGLENRLYRVEIHEKGTLGQAKFKWSRDNASLVATVKNITAAGSGSKITVNSTGRDAFTRFEAGANIELLDDAVEFGMYDAPQGGQLATITKVTHETGEIIVDKNLSGFLIKPDRHPRIRRWDTAKAGDPVLQSTTPGTPIPLEDGITITFGPDASGSVRVGDFWVFAARTTLGDLYHRLDSEPPRGNLHHFMRLGIVTPGTPPAVLHDCRVLWPPATGGGCGCDFCVTEQSHASGALTIQDAVNKAVAAHGGTVCIGIGTFPLDAGVTVEGAFSVRIHGSGVGTVLRADIDGPALSISDSVGVEVRDLTVLTFGKRPNATAIDVSDTTALTLDSLTVFENIDALGFALRGHPQPTHGDAIRLGGLLVRPSIQRCLLAAGAGIAAMPPPGDAEGRQQLFAIDLALRDNAILGTTSGIPLSWPDNIFADDLAIEDSTVIALRTRAGVGIGIGGRLVLGRGVIRRNRVFFATTGIEVSTDNVTVDANTVTGFPGVPAPNPPSPPPFGIAMRRGRSDKVRDTRIHDNAVRRCYAGVFADTDLGDTAICNNQLTECVVGVAISYQASGEVVKLAGNSVSTVAPPPIGLVAADPLPVTAGILVCGTQTADIVDNTITVPDEDNAEFGFGIAVIGCSAARIAGNVIDERGGAGLTAAGIFSTSGFSSLDIAGNVVRQLELGDPLAWRPLYIGSGGRPQALWNRTARLVIIADEPYWRSDTTAIRLLPAQTDSLLGIRGNTLDVKASQAPIASVLVDENATPWGTRCTFSDNICQERIGGNHVPIAMGRPGRSQKGILLTTVSTLVFDANQMSGPHEDLAVDAWVKQDVAVNQPAWTVLGNITNGQIHINGQNLPMTPWLALNRLI